MELGIRGLGPGVRIGLGASAAVYRARQEQLGRDVAVKLLTERDPSFVRRFEREALALGQLSRLPGILTVHDTGLTEQGEPYLVLQYCPSSLLDRLHREGPLRPAEAARLIARVAVTVAGAHEAGIVHRDLKPANILLTHEGEPLVADLGMASVLGAGITTSIGFTPGYAAPENLRGEPGGPDVDVYALGASLFQLVTGRVPFTDPSGLNNLVALAVAIDSQPVEDLRPLGVPDELCRVIEAAMAKDPARRPTAAALAEQLAAVAERIADVGPARPAAPASHPRVQPLPASGPAPSTIDAAAVAARAVGSGVGPLTPPRPAGTVPVGRFGPSPVDDGPAAPSDLPLGRPPRRAAPPEPGNGGRRVPVPARQRRWLSNATIFGGAGVAAAVVVALLSSLLPTIGEAGEEAIATTTATFFPTTTDPSGFAVVGTTWGPNMEDSTSSMAAYQLQWEAGRERALNGLTGPGVLDTLRPTTGTCPDSWSETAGVDGTSITLDLQVTDPTDATSEPVRLAQGVTAYLNWVNANGGIGPDQLTVAPRLVDGAAATADGGASPPFAVAALDPQLVGPGAADNSAEAACIPRPLSVSRDPVADPAVTPWTTPGPELSLATEARLWTELIADHLAGAAGPGTATTVPPTTATTSPATTATAIPTPPPTPTTAPTGAGAEIVGLVGQSETGTLYRQAFEQALTSRPPGPPVRFITSPEELTVDPEVLVVMGSPQDCQAALADLPQAALAARLKLVAAPCASSDLAGQLAQAQAWYHLPGGLRDAMAYYYGDDAFQRLIDDELRAAGLDPQDRVIRRGFGLYGWLWQQSLEIAAALPGGLTRPNLVASQRQLSGLTHPMLLDGVRLQTGPEDPWLVEGSDVGIGNGSSQGGWLLDVNGETPACRWADGVTRSCQPPG